MGLTTILKKKTGYRLGLSMVIIGIITLLVVVWKWWTEGIFMSSDMLSALNESLTSKYADISLGIGLQIVHYIAVGFVLIVVGSVFLLIRREKVAVTEGLTVTLECPLCKNQWQESLSKSNLEGMGYPEARTLSRRRCAKCGKFVRPKIMQTD